MAMPKLPQKYRPAGWIAPKIKQRQYDKQRGNSHQRGYNTAWRKASTEWLEAHPFCERCLEKNLITKAVLVHHIVPIEEAPERILDTTNFMSLDAACHQLIHAEMRK